MFWWFSRYAHKTLDTPKETCKRDPDTPKEAYRRDLQKRPRHTKRNLYVRPPKDLHNQASPNKGVIRVSDLLQVCLIWSNHIMTCTLWHALSLLQVRLIWSNHIMTCTLWHALSLLQVRLIWSNHRMRCVSKVAAMGWLRLVGSLKS